MGPLQLLNDWWTRWSGAENDTDFANAQGVTLANPEGYLYPTAKFNRYGLACDRDVQRVFRLCSPLSAIVSQKAFAFSKGKIITWNPNTEKPVRGQFKEWDTLFLQPNPYQTQRLFTMQAYTYMQKFGMAVIEATYPAGFEGTRPYRLDVLHNWLIEWDSEINPATGRPRTAVYTQYGKRRDLDVERLILIKDSGSTEIDECTNLPLTRAYSLEQDASNIIAALQAKGQMVTDRGANGIISSGGKDAVGSFVLNPEEKDKLQQSIKRYGNLKHQDKFIVSPNPITFTPTTFDYSALGLGEIAVDSLKSICNKYSYPFTALAEGFEGKYNNSSNGRRDFQDTTIDPESTDFFEQLSLGLGMYQQGCEAYMDYSHVASVQASQQERGTGEDAMATALTKEWDLGIVTRNDIRDKLGYEKVKGNEGEFDKYKFETDSALAALELQNNSTFDGNNVNDGTATA